MEQARLIIRCTVSIFGENRERIWAYVSLPSDRQAGDSYRALTDVLKCPRQTHELLAQALKEANAWRKRYEHLVQLKDICEAIVKVSKKRTSRRK